MKSLQINFSTVFNHLWMVLVHWFPSCGPVGSYESKFLPLLVRKKEHLFSLLMFHRVVSDGCIFWIVISKEHFYLSYIRVMELEPWYQGIVPLLYGFYCCSYYYVSQTALSPIVSVLHSPSQCLFFWGVSDMYEGTRDATINDLGGIEQLLRPLVELDIVVNRPREQACTLLYTGPSSEHKSLLRWLFPKCFLCPCKCMVFGFSGWKPYN